jgi:ubiquinone/menaquinone biosynthesis C-methylase UbiE
MIVLETDSEIAPCLVEDLIADSAQEAILAARNLGSTRWASLARAWSVAYLFGRLESIFASGEEPVGAFRRALDELAEFFASAAKSGFASLGQEAGNDFDPPNGFGTVEGVTGDHYGRLFKEFSSSSYWDEPARLLSLRLTRNEVDLDSLKDKEVLDAGCGGGRYTVAWRKLGAKRAVGIDLSRIGVEDARRRVAEAGISGVEFEEGSVLELPFRDESFDIVFSNGVLHHTVDWKAGIAEIVRVLRKGGLGWLYLIEKPGGLFWDSIEILRVIMKDERRDVARGALQVLGIPANRIFYMLDHVLVPINVRLTREEIENCLAESGATSIRRLTRGADFDRIERIYQNDPYADLKYGVGENRFVFSKEWESRR